jgi:hypothetical protein
MLPAISARCTQKRNYRIQHELENEASRHMSFFPLVINIRRKSVLILAPILGGELEWGCC